MDSTSFRYLLNLTVQMALETSLLDVVTTYLYGDLDAQFHIKPPPYFLPNLLPAQPGRYFGLRICKALYGHKNNCNGLWCHL